MAPGATALMRTPSLAWSSAADFVKLTTACLVEAYGPACVRDSVQAGDRRKVHDGALALLLHLSDLVLHEEVHAQNVRLDHLPVVRSLLDCTTVAVSLDTPALLTAMSR